MSMDHEEEFPPLVELGPPGQYSLPTAIKALNVAMPSRGQLESALLICTGNPGDTAHD
jgi:hypothetical protein